MKFGHSDRLLPHVKHNSAMIDGNVQTKSWVDLLGVTSEGETKRLYPLWDNLKEPSGSKPRGSKHSPSNENGSSQHLYVRDHPVFLISFDI